MPDYTTLPLLELPHLSSIDEQGKVLMVARASMTPIRNDDAPMMLLITITTTDGIEYRLPAGTLTEWATFMVGMSNFYGINVFPCEVEFGITPAGRPFAEIL